VLPWNLGSELPQAAEGQTPVYLAAAYLLVAIMFLAWHYYRQRFGVKEDQPC
jgi:hypothetical protein